MGYITYPRTNGSAKNIKRAEHALLLIEQLLQHFNSGDLGLLLTLLSRIEWVNLPSALCERLLRLLYYNLYTSMKEHTVEDASAHREMAQSFTQTIVDVALNSSNRTDLPLHERINAGGVIKVSLAPIVMNEKTRKKVLIQDLLIFNNGMHVILTACTTNMKYIVDQGKDICVTHRYHDSLSRLTMKKAQKEGSLVTLNLLSDYINKDAKGINEHTIYNIEKIPIGLLEHGEVRCELLRSIGRPFDTYRELGKIKFPKRNEEGYKEREHFLPHSLFTDGTREKGNSRSNIPLRHDIGSYTERDGLAYPVLDSQTEGTEHRLLTEAAINIACNFINDGQEGTLLEWLDEIEKSTIKLFSQWSAYSESSELARKYTEMEAKVISACLRKQAEQHYTQKLGISLDCKLSNAIGYKYAKKDDGNSKEAAYE